MIYCAIASFEGLVVQVEYGLNKRCKYNSPFGKDPWHTLFTLNKNTFILHDTLYLKCATTHLFVWLQSNKPVIVNCDLKCPMVAAGC